MRAVRLEAFAPEDEETVLARRAAEAASKSAYDAGYQKGFSEGAAASADEYMKADENLRAQFIEALRDAEISHQAARSEASRALFTVVGTLIERLATSLAQASAPVEILQRVEAALEQAPKAELKVFCAPELVETLRETLEGKALPVLICPEPRFTPLEARIAWDDGFDRIDFDAALEDINGILSQFTQAMLSPEPKELADAG